jgi:uncharacterized protein (TIGR00297 family)
VLTVGGAAAAVVVGAITYAAGTWAFTAILLAFFVPSVVLSRLGRARKRATLIDVDKQGPRDAAQVLANGGIATACALGFALTRDHHWAFAFVGAYAAATADTWATEIGTFVGGRPRSILTLRPLATGISGGVTLVGTLAEIAGAWWLGTIGVLVLHGSLAAGSLLGIAGVVGALVDSVLGASAQELRRCPACERACETDPHVCGSPTRRVRGLPGVTNDVVNAVATLVGAAVGAALY